MGVIRENLWRLRRCEGLTPRQEEAVVIAQNGDSLSVIGRKMDPPISKVRVWQLLHVAARKAGLSE